jgi:prepilin-type N-terminal cleavage/methylation domain-containing protein
MRGSLGVLTAQLRSRRGSGFTLIELSIVVLIVGLLLGSILVPLNAQLKRRNVAQTEQILEDTREALIGYAMANGRLPRPAKSVTDPTEMDPCNTNAECTGPIPWALLGTPKTDAWGKVIWYSVSIAFSDPAPTGQPSFSMTTDGTRNVQSTVAASTVDVATNVPAVILSFGPSNHGTYSDGTSLGDHSSTNVDEDRNAQVSSNDPFISRPPSDNTTADGGEFDDQVIWISRQVLVNRMVSAGQLP